VLRLVRQVPMATAPVADGPENCRRRPRLVLHVIDQRPFFDRTQ
jgi:hypothetical protein